MVLVFFYNILASACFSRVVKWKSLRPVFNTQHSIDAGVSVVGSIPLGERKYLIFSCPRSGNKAKRGVEILRSKHNISRIRRILGRKQVQMETEGLKTRFPGSPCPPYYVLLYLNHYLIKYFPYLYNYCHQVAH